MQLDGLAAYPHQFRSDERRVGQARRTAVAGGAGTFLGGGEFPRPISTGWGEVSVQYKNFGVSLTYTPTVLSNGRISIRVAPEVSEITTNGAVVLNGFSIPAVNTRRAETTVELGSGESFMIAGLMQNSYTSAIDKTPGLADVPILGTLFKSDGYRRNETELMIVSTPYLVKPVSDRDRKSTRRNSRHHVISYAVFCLKKKKRMTNTTKDEIYKVEV